LAPHTNTTPSEQEGRRRLSDTFLIELSRIIPDPDQPRKQFDQMELLELASSVKERGVKQPLTVRWNSTAKKYMIIDGGRRYEAARQANLEELPCWIQRGDRKEVLIDQIVHNWQRSSLRPMETADALVRLRDEHGLTQTELCRVIGKGKSEISKFLALHDKVDPAIQEEARQENSRLSKRHLYSMSKLKPKDQINLANKVREETLTARETEDLAQQKSTSVRVRKSTGLAARQRRFSTNHADVVITFHKQSTADADVRNILGEIETQLRCGKPRQI